MDCSELRDVQSDFALAAGRHFLAVLPRLNHCPDTLSARSQRFPYALVASRHRRLTSARA